MVYLFMTRMTVLSRLGPALGSSRLQLLCISSLRSHQSHPALQRNILGTRRAFSVANGLETAVYDATQLITSLHSVTGTPWYITVPLAALVVNLAVRLPVTIYSRRLEQKRTRLNPLFWAWNSRHTEDVVRANPGRRAAEVTAIIQKKSRASERRISKAHGVQTWKIHYLGSFTALPFFVTAIQGVRRLCGAGGGLFELFSNPLPRFRAWMSGSEGGGEVNSAAPAIPELPVDHIPWTTNVSDVGSQAAAAPVPAPEPLSSDLLGYEPSLSTGGCLWFPDLTVPDPTHALPYMLSAAMLYVVLPRNVDHTRRLLDPTATDLNWRTRFHRALLVISLAIGPLTMHLPAAMHLYWISSTLTATTLRDVVHRIMKLPRNDHQRPKGRDVLLVQPPPLPRE
jgi:inner membrane protein COX18